MKLELTTIIWAALVWTLSTSSARASAIRASASINFTGNAIVVDSFDSADPAHSDDGFYPYAHPEKALSHGDVLTTAANINAISVNTATIKGRAATGPNGTVSVGSSGSVTGGIYDDVNLAYPDASIPADFNATGIIYHNVPINGVTYGKVIFSSADYLLTSLSGSLYIASNITCRIKFTGNVSLSGAFDQIRVASGARVRMYLQGASFSVKGNGIVNENPNADSLMIYGLPPNVALTFGKPFTGTIYAPQADFVYGSGGNGGEDFVGCVMAESVQLNGHVNFHFDENLYRVGPFAPTFTNQPQSQTIPPGGNATFTSAAIGPGTLSYQWYFWPNVFTNWVAIPDATNATLTVTNHPGIPQGGFYRVVATNGFGSTTSTIAQLTLALTPTLSITSQSPFQFNVIGINGLTYAVESSTNLVDWERVITNTAPFSFTDTNLDLLPQRLYRAVYPP